MRSFKKMLSVILSAAICVMSLICVPAYADGVKLGDVDGNGDIAMTDVVSVQRYIAKLAEFTPDQVKAADVDGNNEISMLDVVTMQRYIAKLITSFDVDVDSDSSGDTSTDTVNSDTTVNTDTSANNSDTIDSDKHSDTNTNTDSSSTDTSAVSDDDYLNKTLDIAGVLALGEGKKFKARGQVSYMFGTTSVIVESVDSQGKVSGLLIYDKPGIDQGIYNLNDIIEFTGTTESYEGMIEVKSPQVTTISSNNAPFAPVETTVADVKNHIATVVVINNGKLGAYGDNTTITDATGSAKMYKPVAYPNGVHEGSVVNLVCVPVLHGGEVELRVTYKENYTLVGHDTDTSTAIDTTTDTTTDTSTAIDTGTDTSTATDNTPETDVPFDQRETIKVKTATGTAEATKVYKLSELQAGKKIIIRCGNRIMTSVISYGYVSPFELPEDTDVTLERNCVFEYVGSSGTNYLMDDVNFKYLGVKSSSSTEADYYDFNGFGYDELSEITISGKNGVFSISNRRSERHLALMTTSYSPNFQWIKNGENTGNSNFEIFMVF